MQPEIDVTVIVPAYQASEFVGVAVRACLAQTGIAFELLVVDDGSPEPCEAAVTAAAGGDTRVKYIQMPVNGGPSAARNRALDLAQGRYVAVLDADDSMEPDRLSRMVAAADDLDADIVVDHVIRFDFDTPGAERTLLLDRGMADAPVAIDLLTLTDPASDSAFGAPLGYLKPLFRRAFIEAQGVRYDPSLRNSEDHYFVAELLAASARMFLLPFVGYHYAIREGSLSYRISPAKARAIIAAERSFRARHTALMTPQMLKASDARLDAWTKVAEFETLIDALKRRNLPAALGALLATPGHAAGHLDRLVGIATSRLR